VGFIYTPYCPNGTPQRETNGSGVVRYVRDLMSVSLTQAEKLTTYQPRELKRDFMREIDAFYARLGSRIRELRDALGMTQQDLADQLNLARTSVTNIERGRQRILADQLQAVASALQTNCDDLLQPSKVQVRSKASGFKGMPTVAEFVEEALDELAI